jgi:integrase
MQTITTVGLDIAKSVFQVHGVDAGGRLAVALYAETKKTGNQYPAAAIKLLLLTGARRGEIFGLQWQSVDLGQKCLRLPDSKTGAKVIFLNEAALDILRSLPRLKDNLHVIPGTLVGGPFVGIDLAARKARR